MSYHPFKLSTFILNWGTVIPAGFIAKFITEHTINSPVIYFILFSLLLFFGILIVGTITEDWDN